VSDLLELKSRARESFDLTDPSDHQGLRELAERMLTVKNVSAGTLRAAGQDDSAPLEYRIATKLAESRQFLRTMDRELKVAVVYAMWGERKRLQPRNLGGGFPNVQVLSIFNNGH